MFYSLFSTPFSRSLSLLPFFALSFHSHFYNICPQFMSIVQRLAWNLRWQRLEMNRRALRFGSAKKPKWRNLSWRAHLHSSSREQANRAEMKMHSFNTIPLAFTFMNNLNSVYIWIESQAKWTLHSPNWMCLFIVKVFECNVCLAFGSNWTGVGVCVCVCVSILLGWWYFTTNTHTHT